MQEAVVKEVRAQRLDLNARAKFNEPGESILESRQILADKLRPQDAERRRFQQEVSQSAKALEAAANVGQFDVG